MQIQNANKEAAQSVDIKNIKELFTKIENGLIIKLIFPIYNVAHRKI